MRTHSKPFVKRALMAALCISVLPMAGCAVVSDYLKNSLKSTVQETPPPNNSALDLYLQDELTVFHTHKKVNDYTSRLAHDLGKSIRHKALNTPVAVASFVHFDNVNSSSTLGNLISESLIGQLQNQAIPTVDIHLMDAIRTTKNGGIVFNRQMADYFHSESIDYVLSGTMIKGLHGLTINARIVQFTSQEVVSSATTLIPYYVADMYN